MKRIGLVMLSLVLLSAGCGERDQPDDQGLHQDLVNARDGVEVTFDATVLSSPVESGGHERFEVKDTTGENLEIDHNTDLATYVPLATGSQLIVHGRLYVDPGPRYGVHCTHAKTSSGCPYSGWIEFGGNYYE